MDEMKKLCNFNILEGDKFVCLRGDKVISDYDGLVECRDDSDIKNMLLSYERHKDKSIDIYTLRKNDIFMSSFLGENSSRENSSEQVSETIVEEHESANSIGTNVVKRKTRGPTRCVKIINLQEGQKLVVQFDEDHQAVGENATDFTWFLGQTVRSRTCCPLKVNGWKEIEQDKIDHMWDIILKKSTQNKTNRSKRSLPPYSGTKSYARLRYEMV
ncbi:uncharacterized protein [Nicotiana tomentosiformis]|uniref:uncharacterized protein n=1 Tax=Nicotiana tomentosiformis TaxID=4098 RepID=UPI00388CA853